MAISNTLSIFNPTIQITVTPETCQNNGSAQISITSVNPPAFYSVVKDTGEIIRPWASLPSGSFTINELAFGTYKLLVYDGNDSNSQSNPVERSFTIADSRNIIVIPDVQNIRCFGDEFGRIRFTVPRMLTGGNNIRVRYKPLNGIFFPERTVGLGNGVSEYINNEVTKTTDFPAGTYIFQVRQGGNAGDCYLEFPIVIEGPPGPLNAAISTVYDACQGNTATVNATGGWGNYSYLWSNGQTTQTAVGLSPGSTHTVKVTDAEGCLIEKEVTIGTANGLAIDIVQLHPTCNQPDGNILIRNTNIDLQTYDVIWRRDNALDGDIIPSDGNGIANLDEGNYHLIIRHRTLVNCVIFREFNLTYQGTPVTVLDIDTPVICEGDTAELLPTVADELGTVEYRWYRDPNKQDPVIDNYGLDYEDNDERVIYKLDPDGRLQIYGLSLSEDPYEYYVEVRGEEVCEAKDGELTPVRITVNPKPAPPMVVIGGGYGRN
ncbi:SprB repeat-containing protein [Anditalea andensis]|nr:SprB repeat-containing protein [Anditalea andensis]